MRLLTKFLSVFRSKTVSDMIAEAKWLKVYVRKYFGAIIIYITLGILGTLMGLAVNWATKYLIDAVTGAIGGDASVLRPIFITAGLMAGLSLGNILFKSVSSRISARIGIRVRHEIQADVYNRILEADWEALSVFSSGDLINRLSSDTQAVSSSITSFIPSLITLAVQFVGALAIMLYYDSTMALIALLGIPVSAIVSKILVKRIRLYSKRIKEMDGAMMAFTDDSFQNLQSLKAFDITKLFAGKMRRIQAEYKSAFIDYNRFSVYMSAIMSIVGLIVSGGCMAWGVYRLWLGAISYGTMTLFLLLAGNLSSSFSALLSLVPTAISTTTSARRIMDVTELPRETRGAAPECEQGFSGSAGSIGVKAERLSFVYSNGINVLDAISFTALPGEITAIVGPSGEGKTTLIRILLGLVSPTEGSAVLVDGDGHECAVSPATRKYFSFVPQENTVFSGTVAENLRMVKPDATDAQIVSALEAACAYEFVKKLPDGINTPMMERGKGISEGQAQRLSIARAVLRDAPVMLLDEATSALDVALERRVLTNIMRLRNGRTCIVITHRPSVLSLCASVYRIDSTHMSRLSGEEVARMTRDF